MYDDLMVKAKSMSSQEFRAYVDKYKEDMEEKYRKQGGGVLGGEWIWRDPKGKHTRTSEKVMGVMMVMIDVDYPRTGLLTKCLCDAVLGPW
jgi:hypothetical protein